MVLPGRRLPVGEAVRRLPRRLRPALDRVTGVAGTPLLRRTVVHRVRALSRLLRRHTLGLPIGH
ncbi:hypothetical protein CGQ36_11015 [Nocardiopsis dassonvillei]|nr:hypothetical protein CGQ36_11015 [Nocardiopsis dassonvillei]